MKKPSIRQLEQLEAKLLKSDQTREINTELAEEFLMADLYFGTPYEEINKEK